VVFAIAFDELGYPPLVFAEGDLMEGNTKSGW
jgi:hypothetical protein